MRTLARCALTTLLLPGLCATALAAGETTMLVPAPQPPVVQVSGEGEATSTPDRARISMAVEARNIELRAAEAKANEGTRLAVAEFKALGLKDADINTAGYALTTEFDWVNGKQKFKDYLAVRSIELTVRDLGKVGDVLLAATRSGITSVQPPVLEATRIKDAERLALSRATEDAQQQAQTIAGALGMKLGAVRTIGTASTQRPVPMFEKSQRMAVMAAAPADASGNEQMGFSAGEITSHAQVSAEFLLLP